MWCCELASRGLLLVTGGADASLKLWWLPAWLPQLSLTTPTLAPNSNSGTVTDLSKQQLQPRGQQQPGLGLPLQGRSSGPSPLPPATSAVQHYKLRGVRVGFNTRGGSECVCVGGGGGRTQSRMRARRWGAVCPSVNERTKKNGWRYEARSGNMAGVSALPFASA